MRTVHLVFGPKTRIVPVRVEGGRVNGDIIVRKIKPGEHLLGTIGHYQGKLTPTNAKKILGGQIETIETARMFQIIIPEMIDINDRVGIMETEGTVGLFKQVMGGYKITGHNSDILQTVLANPAKKSLALTFVSLLDAREFAKRLSALTGRKFRVQEDKEWEAAKGQLSGEYWTWTATKYGTKTFLLRNLLSNFFIHDYPDIRKENYAIRLVEDR